MPTRRVYLCGLVVATFLASCGGGSGGSNGQGSGISISPGSLSFSARQGGSLPAPQRIQITVSSTETVYVGAAYVSTQPSWMTADSLTGSGASWSLLVRITGTSLAPGTYNATLRIGIARADQSIIAYRDAVITYTVTSALSASPASLTFKYVVGGPTPPSQDVTVGGAGLAWTASTDQGWIRPSSTSGTAPATLHVGVDPTGLAPGAYAGSVTVSEAGGQSAAVGVQLTVDAPALEASPTSLSFSGVNGTTIASQGLSVSMNNGATVSWTASADASWLVLSPQAGSAPGSLTVAVDPSQGPLASGTYSATITLTASYAGSTITRAIPVGLTLTKPVLTLQPSSLVLGGPVGRDLQAQQVTLSLDTGAAAFPWVASTQQAWIGPSTAVGTVSATAVAITVGPDVTGLAGGTYQGSLGFTAAVNGDLVTATLPVLLNLDDHRLVVSDTGVAFANTPTLSRLSRTLKVLDNFGLSTGWTATSSQPWLSATASGTAGGDLVLTASPTGRATDTFYTATVTVSPSGGGIPAETIQVGLWVGATDPAAATTLNVASTAVITDPIRPYAYVNAGGSSITVYNVFTTQVVATISSVAAQLGSMTVSLDGSKLYAVDRTNFRIVPVDLATRTVGTPFAVGAAVGPSIYYTRTNGKGLILAGNRCIYDAATGAVRYPAGGCTSTSSYPVSSSVMGNIFSIDSTAYRLDYTAAGGGTVVVGPPLYPNITMWNSEDYAFNADGSRMYLAVGSPYDFYVVDTTVAGPSLPEVQVLPGAAYPNNVEVARDGRIFAAIDGYADSSGHDAWIYAPDGTLLKAFDLAYYGIGVGTLKVSGDGLRMVSLPNGNYLTPVAIAFNTTVP